MEHEQYNVASPAEIHLDQQTASANPSSSFSQVGSLSPTILYPVGSPTMNYGDRASQLQSVNGHESSAAVLPSENLQTAGPTATSLTAGSTGLPPTGVGQEAAYYQPHIVFLPVGAVGYSAQPVPIQSPNAARVLPNQQLLGVNAGQTANHSQLSQTNAVPGLFQPHYQPQVAAPTDGAAGYYSKPFPVQTVSAFQGSQEPRQVVQMNHSQPPYVRQRRAGHAYTGPMAFACLVTWFCNIVFGAIAFLLAMLARRKSPTDERTAKKLARASVVVSAAGIVVTVIIVVAIVAKYGGS